MNKNLLLDIASTAKTEDGKYMVVFVALCDLEEYKEITKKIKENDMIDATF